MSSIPPLSDERKKRIRRLHTRKQRERAAEILIEGPRAISAAVRKGIQLRYIVVEEGDETVLSHVGDLPDVPVFQVSGPTFQTLAQTQQPQGIVAVVGQPVWTFEDLESLVPAVRAPFLILDGLQDPGNVGTLLRTAVAMGCPGVFLLEGTTDPWSPKVVRASAGELFGVPIVQAPWTAVGPWLEQHDVSIWVADAQGADIRTVRVTKDRPIALVLGNEGQGCRPGVIAGAMYTVSIPLLRGVESLNAAQAGTILLWMLGPGQEAP